MMTYPSEKQTSQNLQYKYKDYWDQRYLNEETFEWCKSYEYFKHLIVKYVNKTSNILILGCGNSKLSEELYNDGYENITNIDFSSIVLQNVASQAKAAAKMEWLVMDIKRLLFLPGSFDVVLEKATLDSLLVGETDPWKMSEEGNRVLTGILMQVSQILVEGGKFLSLTFAQPHFRKKLLCKTRFGWSVEHETYGDGFHFFFYVMTKGEPLLQVEEEEEEEEVEEGEVTYLSEDDEDFIFKVMDEDFTSNSEH